MSAQSLEITTPALASLKAQPQVAAYFEAAVRENKINHAYLFVGSAGAGQVQVAEALAKCIVCPNHGCNACEECVRVARKSHPDIHWISPEGANGYVIEQVRSLIADVQLAPVRAAAKVYILDRIETLKGTCANALLKTIEEPPAGVIFVLMARTIDSVLPTIASRCQVVPFRVTNSGNALSELALSCGVADTNLARIALSVTGTPERAAEFLRSPARQELRRKVVRTFGELERADMWDVLKSAEVIMDAYSEKRKAKGKKKPDPYANLSADQKAQKEVEADFLSAKALKLLEQRANRELTAREYSGMMEIIASAESLLRDVLARTSGAGAAVVNTDAADIVERLSAHTDTAGTLKALEACTRARADLSHNVTPQLILEVMLCSCKEALCPPLSR